MENFIYTMDEKTIEILTRLGCPLFEVNGDIHVFVNTPSFQEFSLNEPNDLKMFRSNKIVL